MTDDFDEAMTDRFDEAFGVYVGSATYEEVVRALRDVPAPSELVVRIDNRRSPQPQEGVVYRHGLPEHFGIDDDEWGRHDLFVLYQREQALGYGVMYRDAPFVLVLNPAYEGLDADRFTGGVRIRSPFGTVLDIAVWHTIGHVTETGDVAPGFGGFTVTIEEDRNRE
jgi:hypothetical protein